MWQYCTCIFPVTNPEGGLAVEKYTCTGCRTVCGSTGHVWSGISIGHRPRLKARQTQTGLKNL